MDNGYSIKSRGKQPAHKASASSPALGWDDQTIKTASSPLRDGDGVQTRQKRVLPSRSRRGGPGIGSCEVDIMILESHRRKFENEPLVPAETRFLMTTNSALVPSSSSSAPFEVQLNSHAYERYFDRPEVIKAYREQQMIQTPEFCLLSEDASVGGRFRPRGSEDESADTSDAAYEKRHRKYETFEKRQRLREKEKLKHEQYKLKERIDQLRAMDASAFLGLPASSFASLDSVASPSRAAEDDSNVIGVSAHIEGERRRNEMLSVAHALEERYQTLLPPDRKGPDKSKNGTRHKSISFSVEPEIPLLENEVPDNAEAEDGESEIDVDERKAMSRPPPETITLKIKLRPPTTPKERKPSSSSTFPRSPLGLRSRARSVDPLSSTVDHMDDNYSSSMTISVPARSSVSADVNAGSAGRSPKGRLLQRKKPRFSDAMDAPSTRKHVLRMHSHSDQFEPLSGEVYDAAGNLEDASDALVSASRGMLSANGSAKADRSTCVLLIAAQRSAPNARKTQQRHVTAFGTKVPLEVDELRDFELPYWLHDEDDYNEVTDGIPDGSDGNLSKEAVLEVDMDTEDNSMEHSKFISETGGSEMPPAQQTLDFAPVSQLKHDL